MTTKFSSSSSGWLYLETIVNQSPLILRWLAPWWWWLRKRTSCSLPGAPLKVVSFQSSTCKSFGWRRLHCLGCPMRFSTAKSTIVNIGWFCIWLASLGLGIETWVCQDPVPELSGHSPSSFHKGSLWRRPAWFSEGCQQEVCHRPCEEDASEGVLCHRLETVHFWPALCQEIQDRMCFSALDCYKLFSCQDQRHERTGGNLLCASREAAADESVCGMRPEAFLNAIFCWKPVSFRPCTPWALLLPEAGGGWAGLEVCC